MTKWLSQFENTSIPAVCYEDYGALSKVLQVRSVPLLHPQSFQSSSNTPKVLLRMIAAPVNPSDVNQIQGVYPLRPEKAEGLPFIAGNEALAQVVKVEDPQLSDFQVGDLVLPTGQVFGSWRPYAIVPAQKQFLNKIQLSQDRVNMITEREMIIGLSTLSVNLCTAYRMLKDFTALKQGDVVIQNGANSGVGRAVIQLCKLWGLQSVNVIRARQNQSETDQLKQELIELGAGQVVTETELSQSSRDINNTATLALNCVGGESASFLIRALKHGAHHVTYGAMSKQPISVGAGPLIFKDIKFVGFWVSQWKKDNAGTQEYQTMIDNLVDYLQSGKLKVPPVDLLDMIPQDRSNESCSIFSKVSDDFQLNSVTYDQVQQLNELVLSKVLKSESGNNSAKQLLQFAKF
ncbi:hypothetical protein MIR68_009304 [Amoeboaphelidium protococcarum]|nr:hypothetical protein MIR68_009304 [Amoeboaphelidium protococcarum]